MHEQRVTQFYRRLAAVCALRNAVAAATLFAFLWGTVVLVLRALGAPTVPLLWGLAGLPLVVGGAVWVALRSLPDRAVIRALLDQRGDCGGLLMTAAERDLGGWNGAVPDGGVPRVQWRWGRPAGLLAVACGYVVLGFLLPVTGAAIAGTTPLDVGRETDRLAQQVQVLEEEKVIEADRAADLTQKLDQVRDRAEGTDPAKTLEALDHVKEVVRAAARETAEEGARQANQFEQVEAAAGALQQLAPSLSGEDMAAMMKELAAMAEQAAEDGEQAAELPPDLAEAMKNGSLSPEQLEKLAAFAAKGKGKISATARRLYKVRLIDAEQLKECEGGKCDSETLVAFLSKNGCKGGLCDALGKIPGRGGVNEGPGHAELTFGDPSSEEGAKFREEVLPPADLQALKDSTTAGVSTTAPKADGTAPTAAGSLAGAAAGGGSANAAPVLPQHKAAVERYFDRPEK